MAKATLVRVKYFKDDIKGYAGREYTFRTELPLQPFQKVLVPSNDVELKKALVVEIDVPESEIDPAWANRIKTITQIDTEK